MIAVASSIFVIWQRKAESLFGVVTLVCVGYMIFGSYSLTRFVNLPFQERYLFPLLPIAGISLAIMFKQLGNKSRILITIALLIAAGLGLKGSANRAGDRYYEGYLGNVTAGVVEIHQKGGTVFTDARTHRALQHLLPDEQWRKVKTIPQTGNLSSGYYVLHPQSDAGRERIGQIISNPISVAYFIDQRRIVSFLPQLAQKARLGAGFRLLDFEKEIIPDQ